MQQVEDLGAGPPLQISVPTAREDKVVSTSHVNSRPVPCSVWPLPAPQEEGQSRGPPKPVSWAQPFLSEPLVTLSALASCHSGTTLLALVPSPQQRVSKPRWPSTGKHQGDTAMRPGWGVPDVGAGRAGHSAGRDVVLPQLLVRGI